MAILTVLITQVTCWATWRFHFALTGRFGLKRYRNGPLPLGYPYKFRIRRETSIKISRRNLVVRVLAAISCGALYKLDDMAMGAETVKEKENGTFFKLYPVGKVQRQRGTTKLRIFEIYRDALKGLDGFSHVLVLYWFDRNDTLEKRNILQVHPRGNRNNPLTGVFACRAPVRPNLIALSLCKVLSIQNEIITVDKIDAFDGSPILDIKPYIPSIDSKPNGFRVPDWLKD
jgi:tRNA-Thr(GGU) m(6)t(6)A37 methyltransferase TsaA